MKYLNVLYIFILLLNPKASYSQGINKNINDSILLHLGFSPKYFTLKTSEELKTTEGIYYVNEESINTNKIDTIIFAKTKVINEKIIILNKTIPYEISVNSIYFRDLVLFGNCYFKKGIVFFDCKFGDKYCISNSKSDSSIDFLSTTFKHKFYIKSVLSNSVNINNCFFDSSLVFQKLKTYQGFKLYSSNINNTCNFSSIDINGVSNFGYSKFNSDLSFEISSFNNDVVFKYTELKSNLNFIDIIFNKTLNLNSLALKGCIYFDGSTIPDKIDLSNLKTSFPIDFTAASSSTKVSKKLINIYNSDISKITLTENFSLFFDDRLTIDQKNGVYKNLLELLEKSGSKQVYKTFDIEHRVFINKNYNSFIEKIGFYLNKYWWNFGYNKERIFIISLVLIIIFSLVVFWEKDKYVRKVYPISSLNIKLQSNRKQKNKIIRALLDYLIALLYTIFLFFNLKLDFEKISFKKIGPGLFVIFVFTVGLICSGFIFNLIIGN